MEKSKAQTPIRLTDVLILVFVLVVMGLLITDIGGNVADILNRPSSVTQPR